MKRAATVKCVFKDLIRLLNYMYTYICTSLPTNIKHKLPK
jgi:hypothetical protein